MIFLIAIVASVNVMLLAWGIRNIINHRNKVKANRALMQEIERLLEVDWDENSYA